MRISIIIPTYNRVNYLKQAIDSALEQDYDDFEIVVSDNASTDGTASLLREYIGHPKVHYFCNNTNIGMVQNWRRAIFELACGEWFILLSDDDYLIDKNYLRNASNLITKKSNLTLIYADSYLYNDYTGEKQLLDLPFSGVVSGETIFCSRGQIKPQDFALCNVIFRRNLAWQLNAFSNSDNLSCDTELFLLSCLHGEVGIIKGAATVYRLHTNNLLKSVNNNPRLCYGSFDSLISPYLAAQEAGLQESAEALRKSACIDNIIFLNMLKIACLDRSFFQRAKADLIKRAPLLARTTFRRPSYKILERLCLIFPFLYDVYKNYKIIRKSLKI